MDWFHDETTLLDEVKRTRRVTTRPLAIDGFEDIQLLRRGGQGAVYTAVQQSTRRRVAIKVLHDDGLASETRRRRFELEIDLIAKLQHPNIVHVYDSGVTDDDRLYFVMEYIEGLPLGEYVGTTAGPGAGLTVEKRMRLFAEICEAVAFAHRHGVIHRDLKPSNIRIDADGRPHVLDFGIAKLTTADAPAAMTSDMTLTGQFLGTLAYASPEQLHSDPALVDIRTDVYALGVMLYEMLTGRHPYPAAGPVAEIISAVTQHDPVAPSRAERGPGGPTRGPGGPAYAQRINDEVDTITLKALAKEPARRYQSAEALQQDVLRYLAGEPIDAKRDSTFYVLRKTVARHRLPATLGAAFLISLICFTIALYFSNERSRLEAAKATQIRVFLEDTLGSVQPATAGRETTVHEVLDEAVHWVEIALTDQPEVEASLRTTIGNSYRSLGAFAKAEAQLQQALQLRRDHPGDRSLEVAESLNSIGMLRRDQQNSDEAERLFREALTLRRELLGPDHIGLTNSLMNLGGVMLDRGRHDEANDLFREALAIRRRARGAGHPDVAMCLYRLAQAADAEADTVEAIELHQQALAIREHALHPEHPDVARSMLALGTLLLRAGEPDEAEPLARKCVEVRRRSLPEGHWQIAEAQSLLGACFGAQRKFERAEELLLQSLDVLRESRGPSDEHTRTAMRRLGELYEAWGRPQEAAKYRATAP